MPRFIFTKRGLEENLGKRKLIYGRWDRAFGCWLITGEGDPIEQVVPDWLHFLTSDTALPKRQEEADDMTIRIPITGGENWRPKYISGDNRLFSDEKENLKLYVDSFPISLKNILSSQRKWTWALLDAINIYGPFENFVRAELMNGHGGFLHAAFVMSDYRRQSRTRRREIAMRIAHMNRAELISFFTRHTGSRQAVRAMGKFSNDVMLKPRHIDNLMARLRKPHYAAMLAHARRIHPKSVLVLSNLPDFAAVPNLAFLLEDKTGVDHLQLLANWVSCLAREDHEGQKAVRGRLTAIKRGSNISEKITQWEKEIWQRVPFPPPPVLPLSPLLVPLTESAALQAEGRSMQHCLGNTHAHSAYNGHRYFYAWFGEERATVALEYLDKEWIIGEIKLSSNNPPSYRTVK